MNIKHNSIPLEIDYFHEPKDDSTGSPESMHITAVWFKGVDVFDIYLYNGLLGSLNAAALDLYKSIRADERAEFIMSHKNNEG